MKKTIDFYKLHPFVSNYACEALSENNANNSLEILKIQFCHPTKRVTF